MFFNKKKKAKLDARVRFQHRQFTQKLDKARQFKRTPRAVPETKIDKLLSRIYLGSRWSQIALGLGVLAILYVVYVPNFLSLQHVTVNGASDTDRLLVEGAVRQAIADAPFYNPQRNILFLNTDRAVQASLSVNSIYQVKQVRKSIQQKSLSIEVVPKFDKFLVADSERVYLAYNDGSLRETLTLKPEEWLTSYNGLLKIKAAGKIINNGNQLISEPLRKSIEDLDRGLGQIKGSSLSYFDISVPQAQETSAATKKEQIPALEIHAPLVAGELRAVLKKGIDPNRTFTVIVDAKTDLVEAADRLRILLLQTDPARYNAIQYIDMRLENRGYVCLQDTPCAS